MYKNSPYSILMMLQHQPHPPNAMFIGATQSNDETHIFSRIELYTLQVSFSNLQLLIVQSTFYRLQKWLRWHKKKHVKETLRINEACVLVECECFQVVMVIIHKWYYICASSYPEYQIYSGIIRTILIIVWKSPR